MRVSAISGILILVFVIFVERLLVAQPIRIRGEINSEFDHSAVKDAVVRIFNQESNSTEALVSNREGHIETTAWYPAGQIIKIQIEKPGFFLKAFNQAVEANLNDSICFFSVEMKPSAIVKGVVRDSLIRDLVLGGVEIYHFDGVKEIQEKSTDDRGTFNFATEQVPGRTVNVVFEKKGYWRKEVPVPVMLPADPNSPIEVLLPKLEYRARKMNFRVIDYQTGKPISQAKIYYCDMFCEDSSNLFTNEEGVVQINIFQRPGTRLETLRIEKDKYYPVNASPVLADVENSFESRMVKRIEPRVGYWCLGGAVAAATSGGLYWASCAAYKKYKKYGNPVRESNLKNADSLLTWSAISAGVAVATFAGLGIRIFQKTKNERLKGGFLGDISGGFRLGVHYRIN